MLHLLAALCHAAPALVHQHGYDLAGNRVRAAYSTGRVVETSYDGLNRPEVISEGGRATRYGYDLAGRAVVLVAGNGQTSVNTYDALGRLQDRTLFRTSAMTEAEVQAEFSWEHDALGNVLAQHETWPGETTRQGGIRSTVMAYDANNRLIAETIQTRANPTATPADQSTTACTYDAANNRATKTVTRIAAAASSAAAGENEVGHWAYTYNSANQLTAWEKWDEQGGSLQKSAALSYDDAGNRTGQSVDHISSGASDEITSYTWDAQDRLLGVTMPDSSQHAYAYDYRTRRIGTSSTTAGTTPVTKQTAIVFSGGLSVAEWESDTGSLPAAPTVEYTRGPDMGGGVGGLLYSLRSESSSGLQSVPVAKYNLSNGRGDIVAQSNQSAALTWTASYEAYGKRTKETGANQDKQRGNSKDEDPTGLLNEGFRYRDLETGVWLSRDPAGFVDGPNVYAYVKQNPWSAFDPKGLDLQHLGEAWMKGDLSLQTFVGEGGFGQAILGMPAPNDVARGCAGSMETATKIVATRSGMLKAGATNAQANVAAGVMTLGAATGALKVAEAIDGNKIVATSDGSVTTQAMGGLERVEQGVSGAVQMGGVFYGASSLRSRPTKGASGSSALKTSSQNERLILNVGGEGEVPGATNIQGKWVLHPDWRSSRTGQTLKELQEQGHKFEFVDHMAKLPYQDGAVEKVITNNVPLDTRTHLGPAPSSAEIRRVLKPEGKWEHNGTER